MTDRSSDDSALLLSCVQRAIELMDQGVEVDYVELCEPCPDLIDTVRDVVARQRDVEHWADAEAGQAVASNGLAGRVLSDRYRLEQLIGRGAMGTVYAAIDLELKRWVAVKLLQPHLFGAPDAEARFEREAETLAALNNPHIIGIHDRGIAADGTHFLVMDLLEGAPLSAVLQELERRVEADGWEAVRDPAWLQNVIPEIQLPARSYVRLCAVWAADLARGLAVAHQAGVYHRDVKPSNVFVTRDGRVLLLDFGIAARADDATLTRGDTTLGTPKYMAPEQARGATVPGPQLDVYSLGATLYHLIGGQCPYDGDARAVLLAVQREEPTPVGRRNRGLPVDLQAIVECAMARSTQRRYGDAAALEADLRAFLDYAPVQARRRGPLLRVWLRARRSRLAQAAVLVVVVAVLAVAVPAWVRAREAAKATEYAEIVAVLPPMLTLGRQKVIDDVAERERIAAMLDRAVALAPDRVMIRSLRGAFRFDHGDPEGAAEDFAALAVAVDTPLGRAVAAAGLPSADGSGQRLDLEALPAPQRPEDRYLLGYLTIRAGDYAGAREWLNADPAFLPSRHLGLLPRLAHGFGPGGAAALKLLYADALELEGLLGRETTRTRYVVSSVLLQLQQPHEAVKSLSDVVELAPHTYGVLLNLGVACTATGDYERAEATLRRALELRPRDPKALSGLAKLYARTERFDEALQAAHEIPEAAAGLRFDTEGEVQRERTLAALDSGELVEAKELAKLAAAAYQGAVDCGYQTGINKFNVRIARSIYRGRDKRLAKDLLVLLREDPLNALMLKNVAKNLPDEIDSDFTEAIREYLRTLAADPRGR